MALTPTNIMLDDEHKRIIQDLIARNKYRSASEVVRRAIEQLEQGGVEFDSSALDPLIGELARLTDEATASVGLANAAVDKVINQIEKRHRKAKEV